MGKRQRFVDFVKEWCYDDSHGYSQINRWGPDCDCSSLLYMAAAHAGYSVPTSGLRYTGTMLGHFTEAGFTAMPFDGVLGDCEPGSILLNVRNHTELVVDWNRLGAARMDEHGGISGCCTGDQTGNEVSVVDAYIPSFGWDYVLIPPDERTDSCSLASGSLLVREPRYRVQTLEDGWLQWMSGLSCTDGCSDDYAGIVGHAIRYLEIEWPNAGGWFVLRTQESPTGLTRNCTGDGTEVIGITIYYETKDPHKTGWYRAKYRVSVLGKEYYKWEYDDEDGYAGDLENPIDRIQLMLEKI